MLFKSATLYITKEGVKQSGVDHGGYGQVVKENDDYIVVKWPSHSYWSGRGFPRGYASPQTTVYKIKKQEMTDINTSRYFTTPAIQWLNMRWKKK